MSQTKVKCYIKDVEELEKRCEKHFKGTIPQVDRKKALAGEYYHDHPLALLVVALEFLHQQEKEIKRLKKK